MEPIAEARESTGNSVYKKHGTSHGKLTCRMVGLLLQYFLDSQALIASFVKVIKQPDGQDIGVELEYDLYKKAVQNNKKIVVLDVGELVKILQRC